MDYVKNPKAIEDKSMQIIYDYVKDLGLTDDEVRVVSRTVHASGTKLQAAMDLGIHVIVIDRPRVKIESHVVSSNDEFFKLWEDTNGLR